MCNCGKKRNALSTPANSFSNNRQQKMPQPFYQQEAQPVQAQIKQTIMFQYTGNTALTVIGNNTRKKYRFNFPGDIQHITPADAAGMAAIPVLKKV